MIKIASLFLIFVVSVYAQTANSKNVSKFEIRDGKKVYLPFKTQPLNATVSNQIVKPDVKIPVIKGFYVDYKKN